MKYFYIILVLTHFIACNDKHDESKQNDEFLKPSLIDSVDVDTANLVQYNNKNFQITQDSLEKFEVDDYSITNEMLIKISKKYPNFELHSGETISFEKAWFKNESLAQTIIIELATDYHRFLIYHFDNKEITPDIISEVKMHVKGGDLASNEKAVKDFFGFINQANQIDKTYFISKKGFKIGDTLQKALNVYGKPDKEIKINGVEKFVWDFEGEYIYNNKLKSKTKPLAKNSFGHQVKMYFKEDKLIGYILFNDIP